MAKIALYGATGTIGARVLREALGRGHRVTAVVRDPARCPDRPGAAVVRGDVLDPVSVAGAAAGQDVVVSAIGPGTGDPAVLVTAVKSLIGGICTLAPAASRPRLITVGGSGSLRAPDGSPLWQAPGVPEAMRTVMHAHADALDFLLTVPLEEVRWTCLSPPAQIEPGERTGTYRLALDDLVVDGAGRSRISAEDYAVALLDEIDRDAHAGRRFTVGA
ncbi:NAD(P)H-binding protein [Streptomyces sp. NPDC006326]|uniref:NAD(P)-dependent oxidoreductase n=1 Tax=Streptomyces sp. NPDC006326 TaxID=3156752 RepID=UPI0033AA0775